MKRRVLNSMNQVGFISEAIDTSAKRQDIESAKKLSRQKTMGLPLRLAHPAKLNRNPQSFFVPLNSKTESAAVKFDEPEVGSLTRQQIKNKLKPEGVHINDMCNWTPIEITKLEFQLVEALTLTVHKSQGATYQSVAFHIPKKYLKCNMLYVGFSRATSTQGLCIDHFPAKPLKPSSKVEHEISRLRTPSCALNPRFSSIMKDIKPLSLDDITTDYGTSIDNVILNVEIAALLYESLISDHSPILLMDKETCNKIEKKKM
ncbi:ATP-dependent DNA helicase PIF1-like [Aphis craccivora]|uniref:ATP-dependent DNA helicase PIF1-like n=1 Tax=Aphis craccivora TaxID=307492 RepID=A0A6G0XTF5_APHCR|nr:ATP-dependent DNA helicase PIF1-like [Aphis craccivora]